MILTCPSCGTQYVVKDGAIPPEGRQVRCAACKHSWHQGPDEAEAAGTQPAPAGPESVAAPGFVDEPTPQTQDESLAEATLIEPRSGPEAEQRAYEESAMEGGDTTAGEAAATPSESELPAPPQNVEENAASAGTADWKEPPHAEAAPDMFSPFATPDEVEPRRRSPALTILVIAILVVILAALFWFLAPPDLKARLGIAAAGASPLALVTTHMDRQRLESGNELLTVTGRVINPTTKEQDVPPLRAQLKSRGGKVVYSWTIAPPARSLPAGSSASFNSAEINVPPGGDELTITLGEPAP